MNNEELENFCGKNLLYIHLQQLLLDYGYEIQQQLNKKPGKRTFLAKDIESTQLVIIKLLSFYSDFEWEKLKLFEREAETLKSISHPQIPDYINYFEVNLNNFKGVALVQNYIPYPSLEECLQSGRTFTESEVKQITKNLLEILIYLQNQHPPIIHRDIKPSNILIGEKTENSVGEVYLIDFGSIQTTANSRDATNTVVGTYGYMPPEQFGDRAVRASDIYSLGATLLYLLTGTHPADLLGEEYRIKFEGLVNLNKNFSNWLQQVLEPSLEYRFSCAVEALQALEKLELLIENKEVKESNLQYVKNDSYWDKNNWISKPVNKPADSRIQVNKQTNKLEVFIPPISSGLALTLSNTLGIAWTFLTIFWIVFALSGSSELSFILLILSLPIWGAGFILLKELTLPFLSSTRLKINTQHILMDYELFGWKYNSPPAISRKNINKLVYVPTHFIHNDKGDKLEITAHLIIWAGECKHILGKNKTFIPSEQEVQWLALQLSEYLDLPISNLPFNHLVTNHLAINNYPSINSTPIIANQNE